MLKKLRNSRYMQYISAFTATLSSAAASMYLVWPSPSLPKLTGDDSPLGSPITDNEGSWMVSVFLLATAPGCILAAWMVERFGRKRSLLMSSVLIFVPWLMIIFGKSVGLLYAARIMAGFGSAIITICCAIYAGEIAEKDIRGQLGTSFILLKVVGCLIVLSVGPYVSYTTLGIICAALPVIFFCSFVFMPESPYYLTKIGEKEDAKRNLIRLSSKTADDNFIEKQLREIRNVVDTDMKNEATLWEFFSKSDYRRPIFIMIGIKTLQQLSGIAAIDGYMQTIVEASESDISAEMSSLIFGAIQLPAALFASFLVDRLGRKPLLLVSALGCAIALIGEGVYFYIQNILEGDVSSIAWLPTTGIAVFVVMNPIGITTLPYVLLGELFPTNIKGIAVSVFTFYGSTLGFVVTKTFQPLSNVWGAHVIFWIYSVICILGAIFVFVFLPETRGKTFSDIQRKLRSIHTFKKITLSESDHQPDLQ